MSSVEEKTHHVRSELCLTRPAYREGRKPTAVKVYSVHHESRYIIVQGVPAVGARQELAKLFGSYGNIEEIHPLDDYPTDKFSEVYLIKYEKIQSARFAKRKLDDYSFFGGVLHVCYAPEYESVQDTREKLQDRRKVIAAKICQLARSEGKASHQTLRKSHPSSSNTEVQHHNMLPPPPPLQPPLNYPTPPLHPHHPGVDGHPSSPPPEVQSVEFMEHQQTDASQKVNDNAVPFTEEMLRLPPPPVPSFHPAYRQFDHAQRKGYKFAWVPTANATFPLGYDPRLPPPPSEQDAGVDGVLEQAPNILDKSNSADSVHFIPRTLKTSSSATSTLSAEESLVSSDGQSGKREERRQRDKIIVKNYKPKGPPPRLVARQVQAKTDRGNVQGPVAKPADDELNKEIRKEAFRLAEEQGASLPTDPELREQLLGQRSIVEPTVEASVVKTVKDIRKRLSKFISETVPKKMKQENQSENPKPGQS